jgi:hypothetical protein
LRRLAAISLAPLLLTGCGGEPGATSPATPASSAPAAVAEGPFTVPADFVAVGSDTKASTFGTLGVSPTLLPLGSALAGPHYAFRIDSIAVLDKLTPEQQRAYSIPSEHGRSTLLPGEGREFLLARMHERGSVARPEEKPSGPLTAAVVLDGKGRPLRDAPKVGDVVVWWGPRGADPLLSVTDEGRTQSITLRTGQRRDAMALFYPPLSNQVRLEDLVHIPALNEKDQGFRFQATIGFSLEPWVPGRGWAPPGRAWLVVGFSLGLPRDKVRLALNLSRSLKISGASFTIPATLAGDQGWSATAEVPESLRSLTVTYRTSGTITDPAGKVLQYTRYDQDNQRAFKLEPQQEHR